jgi:hypothetical protein
LQVDQPFAATERIALAKARSTSTRLSAPMSEANTPSSSPPASGSSRSSAA